ncbi:hypothetical protein BU14_0238s0023 [Porphyra umbilicalis]|uniref:Uncharacterized protein n=1 Tax=Porphyra umbilicalis TaxID=2786 RepID=A0A1X6P3R9_PORUM|nr:hypothetical protein BU14_0238s0023 [Porphyra umbilicalis]|eukprot:OSX75400.1 hypothetical protein BU14_0238s0023 [Porphyra umbilicalis]
MAEGAYSAIVTPHPPFALHTLPFCPHPLPTTPVSLKMAFVSGFTGLAVAARAPVAVCRTRMALEGGKSSGGGEATRDPEPTNIDPEDPKGKQQAIHVAPSFADYLKAQADKKAAEGK